MSRSLRKLRAAVRNVFRSFMVAEPVRPRRDETGAALVEYSLILGFVVIAGIALILLIGGSVTGDLSNTARGFGG